MRINRRVDSVGATRWVKRAETLARSARLEYQTKREIQDGYLLEGRRSGDIRTARVLDLPGRFVPFGHIGIATTMGGSTESWWPKPVGAPVRRVTLEIGAPGDDGSEPIGILIDHDATVGRPLTGWSIGEPPEGGLRSLGISEPYSSHKWIVQVRTVYPNTDPLPVVLPPGGTSLLYRYPSIDYSSVSSLWVMVDVWGAGATGNFTLLINESEIEAHLGYPIIRREPSDWSTQGSDTRAWATMVSRTNFVVAVWLSDGEPAGKAGSLGLMVFEWVVEDEETGDGYWDVVSAHRISNDDMPHPLFQTHYRFHQAGGQVIPPERSFMVPQSVTMNNDGRKAVLLATLYHELDALVGDDPIRYEPIVISGVMRVTIDLETYEVEIDITHVNTDAELQHDAVLVTTNGVSVAGNLSYPWDMGEWAVYCSSHFDGETLHELVGFVRGERTDTEQDHPFVPTEITRHKFIDEATRVKFTTTTYDDEGAAVVSESDTLTNDASFRGFVAPGEPIMLIMHAGTIPLQRGRLEFGGAPGFPAAFCGLGVYEMSMNVGGSSTGASVLFRFDTSNGTIDRVPAPPVSLSLSTCYAVAREVEDEDGNEYTIPARTVVTYRSGDTHTLEIRSGDDVVATTEETTLDYRLGAYYLGNPFAATQYGKMEALV